MIQIPDGWKMQRPRSLPGGLSEWADILVIAILPAPQGAGDAPGIIVWAYEENEAVVFADPLMEENENFRLVRLGHQKT